MELSQSEPVRQSIIRLNLKRHPRFDGLTPLEFCAIYNGIGPDSWPQDLRAALTFVFGEFQELPGSHDVSYQFSDGSFMGWQISLDNWAANSRTLFKLRYPWWQLWRSKERAAAWLKLEAAYVALREFSYPPYAEAFRRGASA